MNLSRSAKSPWYGVILIGLCGSMILCSSCSSRRSQQYTEQGETYLLIGNLDDAEVSFTRAFELDPDNARAKMGSLLQLPNARWGASKLRFVRFQHIS